MKRFIAYLAVCILMCVTVSAPAFAASKTYVGNYKGKDLTYSTKVVGSDYYYKKSSKKTFVKTTTEFKWKRQPRYLEKDIVTIGNGDGFIVREKNKCKTVRKNTVCTQVPYSKIKITYVSPPVKNQYEYRDFSVSMTKTNTVPARWANNAGNGIYYRIPMTYVDKKKHRLYYAQKASITVYWEKKGKDTDVCFGSRYGHNYYKAEPSATVSGKGPNFSLSFNKVKETKPIARVRVKNPVIKK